MKDGENGEEEGIFTLEMMKYSANCAKVIVISSLNGSLMGMSGDIRAATKIRTDWFSSMHNCPPNNTAWDPTNNAIQFVKVSLQLPLAE